MDRLKKTWKSIPPQIRKTLVLILGMSLVIAAPFTGVLPGPGGIPIFLLGVAILATEFQWAERLRDYFLDLTHRLIAHYRAHRTLGNTLIVLLAVSFGTITYVLYTRII